jgi:RNA polymerase sigma-70 factor (family 1)
MKKPLEFDQEKTLKLLAQGSEYAFTQLFDRYYPKVFSIGYDLFKSRELAQEVVQEVFLKLWVRRIGFSDVKELEAFIYTMTKNLALDIMKSRSREILNAYKFAITRDLTDNITENTLQNQEYEELINQAVEKLPQHQKRVYQLSRVDGLTHQAIADRLNISDSTVNNLMTKAVSKIRKDLRPHIEFTFLPVLFEIFKN